MIMDWLLERVPGLASLVGETRLTGIPPAAEFRRMLRRERARVDRFGGQFAMVSFGVDRRTTGHATLCHVARLLAERLRLTDEFGWLDRRHLAAILPCTPEWGAWSLVDDLCLRFPANVPMFECKVFVYPTEWPMPREQQGGADRHSAGNGPSRSSQGSNRRPDENQMGRLPGSNDRHRVDGGEGPDDRRAAWPMDPLFIERLPGWKRAIDILGAGLGLAALAPLFAAVAAAIKLSSPGPVFFAQWRRGLGGEPFKLYKFRSMVLDAEARQRDLMASNEQDGPAFKIKDDPRVTRLGRWLRATSIDELPQLWNVLVGDMSLVGPRPLPIHEADGCKGWQGHRHDVTPGLTCTWQIYGKSQVSFTEWMRMDMRYLRRRTLWRDVKMLLATIPAVLLRKNQ